MAQPLVDEYEFGRIVLDGRTYERDVIVTPSRVVSPWWRREGHALVLDDLREVAEEEVEHVVIGTGYSGMVKVSREVLEFFRKRGVEVHVADTRRAVKIYNELVRKGFRVMGAFHLTC